MKKSFFWLLIVVLVVLLTLGITFAFFGGAVVKRSVNTLGPAVLGVPVSLQDARFMPMRGQLRLSGLHIGNPKGFKTEMLLDVGVIDMELNMASLFSDTIEIRKIQVNDPQITFEQGLTRSNLGAYLDQLSGGKKEPATPADKTQSGRKVVIDELTLTGGKVKLSVTAAMGLSAPIPLATVTMKNIGRESGAEGTGIADIVRIITEAVMKTVVDAIGGAGGLAIEGFKAVGGGVVKVGQGTIDTLKSLGSSKAAEGVKELGQGAVLVGGSAVEGVKQLGSKVGGAVSGVFSGGETNTPAPAAK
ncbi:MAG: AsmA family protein [bacterium]